MDLLSQLSIEQIQTLLAQKEAELKQMKSKTDDDLQLRIKKLNELDLKSKPGKKELDIKTLAQKYQIAGRSDTTKGAKDRLVLAIAKYEKENGIPPSGKDSGSRHVSPVRAPPMALPQVPRPPPMALPQVPQPLRPIALPPRPPPMALKPFSRPPSPVGQKQPPPLPPLGLKPKSRPPSPVGQKQPPPLPPLGLKPKSRPPSPVPLSNRQCGQYNYNELNKKSLNELKDILKANIADIDLSEVNTVEKAIDLLCEFQNNNAVCHPEQGWDCEGDLVCDITTNPGICIDKSIASKSVDWLEYKGKQIIGSKSAINALKQKLNIYDLPPRYSADRQKLVSQASSLSGKNSADFRHMSDKQIQYFIEGRQKLMQQNKNLQVLGQGKVNVLDELDELLKELNENLKEPSRPPNMPLPAAPAPPNMPLPALPAAPKMPLPALPAAPKMPLPAAPNMPLPALPAPPNMPLPALPAASKTNEDIWQKILSNTSKTAKQIANNPKLYAAVMEEEQKIPEQTDYYGEASGEESQIEELQNLLQDLSILEQKTQYEENKEIFEKPPEDYEIKEEPSVEFDQNEIRQIRQSQEQINVAQVEKVLADLANNKQDIKDFTGVQNMVLKCLGLQSN